MRKENGFMITRNIFGKIEPRIGNFFVYKCNNKYIIYKNEPYYTAKATDELWNTFVFDSMVKAYKFLKENIENLI